MLFPSSNTSAQAKAAELLRGHCTLMAFWTLKHAGVLTALASPHGLNPATYAQATSMAPDTLHALLAYLDHQGLVALKGDKASLTALGVALDSQEHPILELLRAHQPVLNALEHLLAKLKTYGPTLQRRPDTFAHAQSLRYADDLYPAIEKVLVKSNPTHLFDLGCAPGRLLVRIAEKLQKTVGVGACDDGTLTRVTNDAFAAAGIDKRFFAFTATITELCSETRRTFERVGISQQLSNRLDTLLAIAQFTELAANDPASLTTHLSNLARYFPSATLLIAEPCLGRRLARQPYWPELELLAHLTHTRYLTEEQWKKHLTAASYAISSTHTSDTDNITLFVCRPAAAG